MDMKIAPGHIAAAFTLAIAGGKLIYTNTGLAIWCGVLAAILIFFSFSFDEE